MKVPCLSGRLVAGAALALLVLARPVLLSQPPRPFPAAEIPLALERLSVLGNALYIAAHPDDENTAMLAYLTHGRLMRTAYLSLTRGDGGQNLIGPEKGELVGVIRTQELLAARRIDGARQFFTRAVDFGYSKSPEETLAIWGKEEVLSDVVRVIRSFRPDIIVTRFPKTGEGGHGQHTASAILAEEAFAAAGDPKRFPEQITKEGLTPWRPKRVFWNVFRLRQEDPKPPKSLAVDLGAFNPYLGRAYSEIAGESRSMHKSQGFGAPERRGSILNYLSLMAGDEAEKDPLEGMDLSWKRVKGGAAVEEWITAARKAYRPEKPELVVPPLLKALGVLRALGPDPFVAEKREEIQEVIRAATGLWVEAIAASPTTYPAGEVAVAATVINRSGVGWILEAVEVDRQTAPGKGPALPQELANNQPVKVEFVSRIPEDTEETHPYWLEEKAGKGLFKVTRKADLLEPENRPVLTARFTLRAGQEKLVFTSPVQYRFTDPVHGERYRLLEVVPKVSLLLEDPVILFPNPASKTVYVSVRANRAKVSGTVRLRVPEGFKVSEPRPFVFEKTGEEARLAFELTPPDAFAEGTMRAEAEVEGRVFSHGIVRIDHPHIPIQTLVPPAESKLVRFGIETRGRNAGYINGSGDGIPDALRQLGYRVTLLSDDDLLSDLSAFDVIIAGIRAYNTRPRLKSLQKRILEYVQKGGTFVAQYNTTADLVTEDLGPYPMKLSRDRVTLEEAPVKFVKEGHPLLSEPNVVTHSDFDGWVQERGLYFPGSWDDRYETVLSCSDPGEPGKEGGLLYARHGKGVFIYTGYAWFRQLPAGVPGAYRVFANLIAARGQK